MSKCQLFFLYLLLIGYLIIGCCVFYFYVNEEEDGEFDYYYFFCLGNTTNGISPLYKKNYDYYELHISGRVISACFDGFLVCSVFPVISFICWSQRELDNSSMNNCIICCGCFLRFLYNNPTIFQFILAIVSFIAAIIDAIALKNARITRDENIEMKTNFNRMMDGLYNDAIRIIISFCVILSLSIIYIILYKCCLPKENPKKKKKLKIGIVFREVTVEVRNDNAYIERRTANGMIIIRQVI